MKPFALPAMLMMAFAVSSQAAEPQVIEVQLDSYTISPDRIVVKVNQPVTLRVSNQAFFIPHNIVIKAPAAGIDVKLDLRAGKSGEASFTPTRPGSYEMVCDKEPPIGKTHREKGMHGMLIVE